MKKLISLAAGVALATVTSGCAAGISPVTGFIYTNVKGANMATTAGGSKTGSATCISYLGAVAEGDCSIRAAKKNGGISTVSSVDYFTKSILGLYAEHTTLVRGN